MSIPVDVERLAAVLAEFGAGYLLTTSADGNVKAVTVEPQFAGATLRIAPSAGSAANLAGNPAATLLFPPPQPRGFTLLVDGTASATPDGIVLTPRTAVLHRPARHADGPPSPAAITTPAQTADGCGNDCLPV